MHLAEDLQTLFTIGSLVSLATLAILEIVLGIDNIIFISIVAGRLPEDRQQKARLTGLAIALLLRVALLFGITLIIGMKSVLFHVIESSPWLVLNLTHELEPLVLWSCSGRDLILLAGGIFLLYKTTIEIRNKVEGDDDEVNATSKKLTMSGAIAQIIAIDLVFSFDSILTAVGLVNNLIIMILAVVIAMIVMMTFAKRVSDFVNKHPTIKMLALAFLLMIGMVLIMDAFHVHVPKGYVYFSMAFSLLVEGLNLRMHENRKKKLEKSK